MMATSIFLLKADMYRVLPKIAFLLAITLSVGGWIWLLGVGLKWLIVKL